MGREVRRVALDFNWPIGKVWQGFINPYAYDYNRDEQSEEYENWKETPPPAGEGWQLWETVSDGSPASPVFATKGELIAFMQGANYAHWAINAVIEDGENAYMPSMVGTSQGIFPVQTHR